MLKKVKITKIERKNDIVYKIKIKKTVGRSLEKIFENDCMPLIEGNYEIEEIRVWKEGFK